MAPHGGWIPQGKVGFEGLGVFPSRSEPAVLRLLLNPKGDPGSCANGSKTSDGSRRKPSLASRAGKFQNIPSGASQDRRDAELEDPPRGCSHQRSPSNFPVPRAFPAFPAFPELRPARCQAEPGFGNPLGSSFGAPAGIRRDKNALMSPRLPWGREWNKPGLIRELLRRIPGPGSPSREPRSGSKRVQAGPRGSFPGNAREFREEWERWDG